MKQVFLSTVGVRLNVLNNKFKIQPSLLKRQNKIQNNYKLLTKSPKNFI